MNIRKINELSVEQKIKTANQYLGIILRASNLDVIYCPFCGNQLLHQVGTDCNSKLVCKIPHCGKFSVE